MLSSAGGPPAPPVAPRSLTVLTTVFWPAVTAGFEGDDDVWGVPLPPEDRLWRHPSEMSRLAGAGGAGSVAAQPIVIVRPRRSMGVVVAAAVAGAALVGTAWLVTDSDDVRTIQVTERVAVAPLDSTPPQLVQPEDWPTAVASGVWPSLVRIELDSAEPTTGIILRDDGLVVTAASALGGEREISVRLSTGEVLRAVVLGTDSVTDLAALSLDTDGLRPALVARDHTPNIGASVVAVGTGRSDASVILGSIDGQGVTVRGADAFHPDLLVIRAHGALAGSPILDEAGSVIAVVTSLAAGDTVYAVPIDTATEVVAALDRHDDIDHDGWMGIEVERLDAETAALPYHANSVRVTDTVPGGPAASAGLRVGDIVVRVNRRVVGSDASFAILVRSLVPNEPATIDLIRDGQVLSLDVELLARPAR